MHNKPSILFIDQDKNILNSLKRLLRKKKWKLFFTDNGNEGIAILSKNKINLVVADIRMPEMDGFKLFADLKKQYPNTTRIVLSGYTEQESVTKALTNKVAQEIIFKPWDDKSLIKSIKKALKLGNSKSVQISEIKKIINSMSGLPSNIVEIVSEFQSNHEIDIDRVSQLIAEEPSISAHLLQWANSSVFGQSSKVVSIDRAAILIGLDMLKGLILSMGVSNSLPTFPDHKHLNQKTLNLHHRNCAIIAKHLITIAFNDKQLIEMAFIGGLLHDIGKIVQAVYLRDTFIEIIDFAANSNLTYCQSEKKLHKLNHSKIGHFLAEWWNLPDFLCDVIRFHHAPWKYKNSHTEVIAAVHIANALVERYSTGGSGDFAQHRVDRKSWEMFNLDKIKLNTIKELLVDE